MTITKKRAIRNTLFRLGLHSKPEEVVRALAEQGVQVSLQLVRQVQFEMLKRSTAVGRQSAGSPTRPTVRRSPKGFPQRGGRG